MLKKIGSLIGGALLSGWSNLTFLFAIFPLLRRRRRRIINGEEDSTTCGRDKAYKSIDLQLFGIPPPFFSLLGSLLRQCVRLVKLSHNLEPSFPIEFKSKQSKILMDDIPNAIVLSLGWLLGIGGLGEPLIFNLHRIAE